MDFKDERPPFLEEKDSLHELPSADPFEVFKIWIGEAKSSKNCMEFQKCSLATCNSDGHPSCRTVYIKKFDEKGFQFFTNYQSKKAIEMIIVKGNVEKLSDEENDSYFNERPRPSQISALISQQSRPVESRSLLLKLTNEAELKYPDKIPRPSHWGGYVLKPFMFEFWQGQVSRLHDRFEFKLENGQWITTRLYP